MLIRCMRGNETPEITLGPDGAPPRSLQWVSSGDGRDAGPVLALEPLSTIWPSNYRHLREQLQAPEGSRFRLLRLPISSAKGAHSGATGAHSGSGRCQF